MLELEVKGGEWFDERTNEFITSPGAVLQMEHSLISVAKWESKWKRSFFTKAPKTPEEELDYYRCMIISPKKVDPLTLASLTVQQRNQIAEYISSEQSASYLYHPRHTGGRPQTVTSEVIYSWMVASQIPFETEKWHLNRLLKLIEIVNRNAQAATGKRHMTQSQVMQNNAQLNAMRRAKSGSRG